MRTSTKQIAIFSILSANSEFCALSDNLDKTIDQFNFFKAYTTLVDDTSLSKDEIERMKMEAEQNAEADKKEKEKIDTLNQAESLIFQTEKQITDETEAQIKKVIEKFIESQN